MSGGYPPWYENKDPTVSASAARGVAPAARGVARAHVFASVDPACADLFKRSSEARFVDCDLRAFEQQLIVGGLEAIEEMLRLKLERLRRGGGSVDPPVPPGVGPLFWRWGPPEGQMTGGDLNDDAAGRESTPLRSDAVCLSAIKEIVGPE